VYYDSDKDPEFVPTKDKHSVR